MILSKLERAEITDKAIEYSFAMLQSDENGKKKIQETVTTSAGQSSLIPMLVDKINTGLRPIDNGWQNCYRMVPVTNATTFRVRKVNNGLTFAAVNEGVDCTIYAFSGTSTDISISTYRAGIDFSNEILEDGDWYNVTDAADDLYNKFYSKKSEVAYDLIQSIPNSSGVMNMIYDTTGSKVADKDANSINSAIEDLITDGMAVAGDTFVIVAPLAMKNRVDLAITGSKNYSADGVNVAYNTVSVYSPYVDWKSNANDGTTKWAGQVESGVYLPLCYVAVKDNKSKWADRMDLTLDSAKNVKSFSTTIVGNGRYAGYVNVDSFRRVLSC
jgi:hypothetical protein